MARDIRGTESAVAVGVILLHALGLYVLTRLDAAVWYSAAHESRREHRLEVEFIEVPARRRAARMPMAVALRANGAKALRHSDALQVMTAAARPAQALAASERVSAQPAELDLSVRDPLGSSQAGQRDAWLDRPPALDPGTTRFASAWAPDGTALEHARFPSKAVDIALGLFGGPPRTCNEVDRRLRKPDCISQDAEALELEALRRSID